MTDPSGPWMSLERGAQSDADRQLAQGRRPSAGAAVNIPEEASEVLKCRDDGFEKVPRASPFFKVGPTDLLTGRRRQGNF